MKTLETKQTKRNGGIQSVFLLSLLMAFLMLPRAASAHCDSYDGPVIQDAFRAFEENNVDYVLKWVEEEHEAEIKSLFSKTVALKDGDQEIYEVVEKYFLETLVRLHREGEGASYSGLKPTGSMTPIIEMADNSLEINDVDGVVNAVNNHLAELLRERFTKAVTLSKTKDNAVEQGRAYVEAYVQYTHTLEALEHILHGAVSHSGSDGHAGH